jgi:Protein of unknown function (DUF4239)
VNPVPVGVGVFVCALGGALFGIWVRSRLPQDHIGDATKDTVKLGIGLVATMTALVLGLITASAKNSFDAVDGAIKHTAVQLLTLDRTLARYGPETREIRTAMKQALGRKIDAVWPRESASASGFDPAGTAGSMEALLDSIGTLKPGNDEQRRLQARARDISESLLAERWLAVSDDSSSIPLVFLVILALWLTITFASFGLFAPRNGTVVAIFTLSALSVASAVFMVLEMDRPLEGLIKVPPDALRHAYERMNL